jgi:SAM-dependent methyltransferase
MKKTGKLAKVSAITLLVNLLLIALALNGYGIAGIAFAYMISSALWSLLLLRYAFEKIEIPWSSQFGRWVEGLFLPTASATAVLLGSIYLLAPGIPRVVISVLLMSAVYAVGIATLGLVPDEMLWLQQNRFFRGFRTLTKALGRKFPLLRSSICLYLAITKILRDEWGQPASFDLFYAGREDPWEYNGVEEEQERFRIAASFLDRVLEGRRFDSALEIGCSEGIFTSKFLVARCRRVLATDYSIVALNRVRARVGGTLPIETLVWNLRTDSVPDPVELVVAMDMLEYLPNPFRLRRACAKIIQCIRPGGYLLFSSVSSPDHEDFWWNGLLLSGGRHIASVFEENSQLKTVCKDNSGMHWIILFQKRT